MLAGVFLNAQGQSNHNSLKNRGLPRGGSTSADTITVPANSVETVNPAELQKTSPFLDTLKIKASKRKLTQTFYNLLIVPTEKVSKKLEGEEIDREDYFEGYNGKTIRQIRLKKLDVFGPDIWDTLRVADSWAERSLNSVHIKTTNRILMKNILFDIGDTLDAMLLVDNERVLRRLPFIRDVRIVVEEVGNEVVDLVVITRDVFSFGFGLSLDRVDKGKVELFDRNIMGIGHEGIVNILWNGQKSSLLGIETRYEADNILGTFIRGSLSYTNAFQREQVGGKLKRRFVTPRTKWAGGMEISQINTIARFDTSNLDFSFRYNYQDYWAGRSFLIDPERRTRIIVSGRFLKNNVFDRPAITKKTYYKYHHRYMALGSIALSRKNYYSSQLIFNYGRTEDIPYGTLLTLTGGMEINEFFTRGYAGLQGAGGRYVGNLGYLASSLSLGGFIRKGHLEQGMVQFKTNYFSNLMRVGRYRVRQFVDLDYTIGIRRFADEKIFIDDEFGIRGLLSDSLSGKQRLSLNLETVVFSPLYLIGFRFTFFGFADMGLVGSNPDLIIPDTFFSGFGLGVRIRNENLVFKTFQVRFGFYPTIPPGSLWYPVHISSERRLQPVRFDADAPQVMPFR
jgi:hypothetical protein